MDELSPEEQTQFKEMEKQEVADQAELAKEKTAVDVVVDEATKPEKTEEPKTVPLNALQEERERRKLAEESKRQLELNQVRLDERIKAINDRLNPPAAPKEIPDPDKDALGALKATAEEMKEFRKFREEQTNQQQQNSYIQNVMVQAAAREAEYIKENPDYNEAGVFLRQSRVNELTALGYNPVQMQQMIYQESIALADAALRQGKNPAEMVHSLAKSRGYVKAATQVVQAQPDTDTDKLAKIAQGQKRNMSLGNVNGTPPKPQLRGEDLVAMDEEQFATYLEKFPMKERVKFLGQ